MPSHKWHALASPESYRHKPPPPKMDANRLKPVVKNGHKTIHDLPNELLAQIFLRMTGASLGKARQVCRKWEKLIRDLDSQHHFWYAAALRDIPLASLMDLGRQFFQELLMDRKIGKSQDIPHIACVDWEDFHHRWIAIHRPLSGVDVIQDNFPIKKRGWNVTTSGNVLFAGISAGIYIIGEKSDGSFTKRMILSGNVVESFALIDLLGRGDYTFKMGADEMLTARHHHIVSLKGTTGLCAIPIAENSKHETVAVLHTTALSLQVCGRLVAVGQEGGIVSLWNLSYNEDRIEDKITRDPCDRYIVDFSINLECFYIVSHPNMKIKMFHLGLQAVTALTFCGKYLTFDLHTKTIARRPTELEREPNIYFLDGRAIGNGIFMIQTITLKKSLCVKGQILPLIPDMESRYILTAKRFCHILALFSTPKSAILQNFSTDPCLLELYDMTTVETNGEFSLLCSMDMGHETGKHFNGLDLGLDLSNQLVVTLLFMDHMVRILFPCRAY